MVQQRAFALVAAVIVVVCSSGYAEILWKQCDGPANDPSVKVGNFYNLCIRKHKFRDQTHAWTIQKTTVSDTSFENCEFLNTRQKTANYSDSVWTNVKFTKCRFGSYTDKPQHFDKTTFRTVTFKDCVFDKTAELMFSNFLMQNVTFSGCRFESNTLFELGQFIDVRFEGCSFKRSPKAVTVSGDDAITWSKLTVRDTGFVKSDFVTPLRIQSVSGADVFFNESTFGELWCHEKPGGKDDTGRQKKEPTQLSAFNDTVIDKSTFRERVKCDRSTWRGMTFFNTTFQKDADFSRSTVQDIYWDEVNVKPAVKTSECHTLDFSNSVIFRKVLANTTVACEADFTDAKIERVFIHRFLAQKPKFKNVVFTDQEYVDSRCCTIACKPLKCKCNITEPSKRCPEGDWTVNVNKFARCFPASAEVMTANGPVLMEHLEHGHRVAVGGGSHSDVFFFGHRSRERYSVFTTILHSGSEKPLRISPEHYLYVNGRLATAETVRIGDRLRDAHGKDSLTVKSLGFENLRGLYAPTSLHGNLVVDGVLVSSYTSVIHPRLAHFALHPLRLLYRMGLGGFVSRFNVFEEQSMEFLPRMIGLPTGPQTVGK